MNTRTGSDALLANVERISPPASFPSGVSFFGKALSDRIRSLHPSSATPPNSDDLITCFRLSGLELCLPKQVHGAEIVAASWQGGRSEADAVIANRSELSANRVLGVRTADCVPLVLFTETKVAVVHAGWRGLASRIVSKTAAQLGEPITHCAIGPCAGAAKYSVGQDVINAIGVTAVYKDETKHGGPLTLDLAETALAELSPWIGDSEVFLSGICTISDDRFFSYRRDRAAAGRNLTLVQFS